MESSNILKLIMMNSSLSLKCEEKLKNKMLDIINRQKETSSCLDNIENQSTKSSSELLTTRNYTKIEVIWLITVQNDASSMIQTYNSAKFHEGLKTAWLEKIGNLHDVYSSYWIVLGLCENQHKYWELALPEGISA